MNNSAGLIFATLQSLVYVDILMGAPVACTAHRLRDQALGYFRAPGSMPAASLPQVD